MIGIYFSGTGNSKHCLERFLHYLEPSLCAYCIEDSETVEYIKQHEEIIISFPVQYSNVPKIVYDFVVQNAALWKDKRVYIIATMGLFSGDGAGVLARLLTQFGAVILGGLHVKMPDSIADEKVLKRTFEKNKEIIRSADDKIKKASQNYRNMEYTHDGLGFLNRMIGLFGQRLYFRKKTKTYSNQIKIDQDQCITCQTCVSSCPMENLILKRNRIISNNRCTMCYRCVNTCPKQAITLLGKKVIVQSTIEKYDLYENDR